MAEEEKKTTEKNGEEEKYELVFQNGALKNLKELAIAFNVPETDLGKLVNKGIQMLKLTKDSKYFIFEDKNGNRFKVDISKL